MRLCVLQSLLASASGVILRARHPGQPQRERLIPALGAKPREAHRAGLSCGSPSQSQQGRQRVPCSPLWFCFCPVGREVDVVPFCWSVTGCKLKPTLGGIASDVGQGRQWCLACLY